MVQFHSVTVNVTCDPCPIEVWHVQSSGQQTSICLEEYSTSICSTEKKQVRGKEDEVCGHHL